MCMELKLSFQYALFHIYQYHISSGFLSSSHLLQGCTTTLYSQLSVLLLSIRLYHHQSLFLTFQIIYEDVVIQSIWFIRSKLWKRFLWGFSGNRPCPKTLPAYSYLFFLSFGDDLLKQGHSFSGGLGGDKLVDLPRASEHETKCTSSALHRRIQLAQLHGVLLVPYTSHAPCSRRSLWDERAKCMKDLEFNYLNKKSCPGGVCTCSFGLFWPHS